FHVEHLHVRLAKPCEQALGLRLADRQNHLDRLVGQFEEVRGVELAVVAEALRGRDQCAAADAQGPGFLKDPFAERLAAVAAVLLGEEGDLVALHGSAPQSLRSKAMVASPSRVMASEPKTWAPMAAPAQARRCSCTRVATSAEKVEKVVMPPRNPVTTSRRHSGAMPGLAANTAMATPTR